MSSIWQEKTMSSTQCIWRDIAATHKIPQLVVLPSWNYDNHLQISIQHSLVQNSRSIWKISTWDQLRAISLKNMKNRLLPSSPSSPYHPLLPCTGRPRPVPGRQLPGWRRWRIPCGSMATPRAGTRRTSRSSCAAAASVPRLSGANRR